MLSSAFLEALAVPSTKLFEIGGGDGVGDDVAAGVEESWQLSLEDETRKEGQLMLNISASRYLSRVVGSTLRGSSVKFTAQVRNLQTFWDAKIKKNWNSESGF